MLKLAIGKTTSILEFAINLTLSAYRINLKSTRHLWFETINHV